MERQVVLRVGNEEYCLGTVKDVIGLRAETRRELSLVIRDTVEGMVFSDDSSDYAVLTLEVH
jgi:hypothetical protein